VQQDADLLTVDRTVDDGLAAAFPNRPFRDPYQRAFGGCRGCGAARERQRDSHERRRNSASRDRHQVFGKGFTICASCGFSRARPMQTIRKLPLPPEASAQISFGFFSTIWIADQLHSARCSTSCRNATVYTE